jgi:hypothetical protein
MVQITNQFERALALLVSQFRGQKANGELTNLQKLIKVLIAPAQRLEDVKWQLKTERWLSTSIGAQLDEIGVILGLPRKIGESDEDYRERLQFQIFINTTSGTPEEVMAVLAFLTQATHVNYHDIGIAAFQLETNGLKFPNPPNELNDGIFQVSPAGVNYAPIVATYDVPISFELGGDLTDQPLAVNANTADPTEERLLSMEIYAGNPVLYVAAGAVESNGPNGGLDELDFPLDTAGQLSELIQKGGNAPARRF